MEILVIGGGLIGLSTAWALGRRGANVTVLEAGTAGAEASWAGAGMLAPGGEMEARTWWGDLALESLALYPAFVRELETQSGVAIDYRACGALESAPNAEEWPALERRAAQQRLMGIRVEPAGERSLFYPNDAAVDPRHLLRALRSVCRIREAQPVREIVAERGRIITPYPCDAAVIAAGAWAGSLRVIVDGIPLPLEPTHPVRGHLISFAPLASAGPSPHSPILRSGPTYLLERSNGLIVAGSTTEQIGFRRDPDPLLLRDIERRAKALMPRLNGATPLDGWIGFRPATISGEPQIGRLRDTPIHLAYGHYRNGILMAPATARFIANQILGASASSQTGCL